MNFDEKLNRLQNLSNIDTGICKFNFTENEDILDFADYLLKKDYQVYHQSEYDMVFLVVFLKHEDQIILFDKFIECDHLNEFYITKKVIKNSYDRLYRDHIKDYVINFINHIKTKNIRHKFGFQILSKEKLRIYKKNDP